MKKVLLIVFVIIGLASCDILSSIIDTTTYGLLEGIEFYDFADYDLTGIDSYRDIARWIQMRVEYKADFLEDFSSPEETLLRGNGDCEDFVFLFMNITYITMGIKLDMAIVNVNDRTIVNGIFISMVVLSTVSRTIVNGGIGNHVISLYDGILYSGQSGKELDYENILYIYTFDEVFY